MVSWSLPSLVLLPKQDKLKENLSTLSTVLHLSFYEILFSTLLLFLTSGHVRGRDPPPLLDFQTWYNQL